MRRVVKDCFVAVGVLVLGFVVLIAFAAFVLHGRVLYKTTLYHIDSEPGVTVPAGAIAPEAQFEVHTCGLHTLRSIYKGYGLDPDRENLRERLGVDVPSNPLDAESTGTVHPDILRVLVQDKFHYEMPHPRDPESVYVIAEHLDNMHVAAFLIRRRENGNLHWIAVAGGDREGEYAVYDSLVGYPYEEDAEDFLPGYVLSCILIRPVEDTDEVPSLEQAMEDGTREMANVAKRYVEQ